MFQAEYFRQVGNLPNLALVDLFKDFSPDKNAIALDLGAGNLRDAKYCLQYGFKKVMAVDNEYQCLQFLEQGIGFYIQPIQQHHILADTYSVILACNVLFFLPPEDLEDLFPKILQGLKKKGIFFFNLIGEEDDWVKYNTHPSGAKTYSSSKGLIEKLFMGFSLEFESENVRHDENGHCHQVTSYVLSKP